jgi:hypothetical protein
MELNGDLSNVPAPLFLRRASRFVVGADLGQSADPTAIAVIEHLSGVIDEGSDFERHTGLRTPQREVEFYDVRHLQRLPLGTSYPVVVERVKEMLARPPLCGDDNQIPAELVIDEIGVGRAVGDIFNSAGLSPIKISITAGSEVSPVGGDRWHVSKTALISTVDALLHTGRLRFAASLTEAPTMKDELQDFRRKLSDAGRATYAARTGKHDDLVLAVAVACWWLNQPPPAQPMFGSYGTFVPGITYGTYGGNH